MRTRFIQSMAEVPAAGWNNLLRDDHPFIRHEFLLTLESSGAASAASGWYPCHLLCESANGDLVGAMPLFLKTNSYGEFVFDFAWSGAYQRAGLAYYPKLVSAIPFTPATGPRLLLSEAANSHAVAALMLDAARQFAGQSGASSLHLLFPDQSGLSLAKSAGLLVRKDCQFHWRNRNYHDFDDFLSTFTASKRKKVRRERRRIRDAGIEFSTYTGHDLSETDWERIMPLYAGTFLRHGREPYLDKAFFLAISEAMPDNLVVFAGSRGADLMGVAICFRSASHLYGRYWGASDFVDSLHFETCYYQGIDYCIEHGLQVFEPGTQGEHKISRGFVPTETWSAHWLSHPQFGAAIDEYLDRERDHVEHYIDVLGEHIPYKD